MNKVFSRREFLRVVSGAAAGAALAACQPAPTPAATPAPAGGAKPAAPTQAAAPKVEMKGKLTCLFHGTASVDGAPWKPRLDMFKEKFPGIEFIGLGSANDQEFTQKMTTMVAGGTPPDMTKISGGRLIATVGKGIYEDLAPRIQSSALMSKIWKTLPGEGKELVICGKQFAIPMDIEARLWFFNRDIFEKEGVAVPKIDWTWEDLLAIGKGVTKADKNQYLFIPGIVRFQDYSDWVWEAGGSVFGSDCMSTNLSEAPNVAAMKFLVDMYKTTKYAPSPAIGLGDIGISFDSGKIAMSMGHTGSLPTQLGPKPTWNFKWGAVFAPKGPKTSNGFVKSNGYGLLKGAQGANLGWGFIEWWFSDETMTKLAVDGDLVARQDIRDEVSMKKLPDHLRPALEKMGREGRGLERCMGWDIAQKYWKQELDTAITGDVTVEAAMATADKKAEAEMKDLMADACKF